MSEHIDRAAEVIESDLWEDGKHLGEALDAAGLLATPAHDAAVAAKALRDAADDLERRLGDPALIESADRYNGYYAGVRSAMQREAQLLHDRADRLEREGGGDV